MLTAKIGSTESGQRGRSNRHQGPVRPPVADPVTRGRSNRVQGRLDRPSPVRVELGNPCRLRVVSSFPCGARPPHPINIKGRGRLSNTQPIESFIFYFYLSNPSFSNLVLFFIRLRDVRRRSEWPADLRTTLRALAPSGSLPSRRS